MHDGRITCVLDLEHAAYADRFRDFGELDEHIFDAYAEGRDVFLASYTAACSTPGRRETGSTGPLRNPTIGLGRAARKSLRSDP